MIDIEEDTFHSAANQEVVIIKEGHADDKTTIERGDTRQQRFRSQSKFPHQKRVALRSPSREK